MPKSSGAPIRLRTERARKPPKGCSQNMGVNYNNGKLAIISASPAPDSNRPQFAACPPK